MERVISFLRELRCNNNREWFTAHKEEYKAVQSVVGVLTQELIDGISSFDNSIRGLGVKDCTYRIYRDTRFSTDKTPYKTHIGIYVCSGGKKSGRAGYYFHIEPPAVSDEERGLCGTMSLGGYMLTSGIYTPEPAVLKSIREDICYNGEAFVATVKKATGFTPSAENTLKRLPAGFPVDSPYAEYLKMKDLYLEKRVDEKFMLAPDLAKRCTEEYRKTYDFIIQINRAVDYAHEQQ